jgi:hypothetical protein
MYFPQKVFFGVFELPLLRNAKKRHKKLTNLKKEKYLPTPFIICQVYVAFNFIFLRRPSGGRGSRPSTLGTKARRAELIKPPPPRVFFRPALPSFPAASLLPLPAAPFGNPKGILQKSKKAVLKVYSQRTNFLNP